MEKYDLIIIGAGPAGLAASIYASRYNINHLVLGQNLGGTIAWAHKVENYPGFPSISGFELAQNFLNHAQSLGGKIENQEVVNLEKINGFLILTAGNQKKYQAKTLIIATGTKRRKLNVPGEKDYLGKGVSYCATCDAAFYKNKDVVVVGGANSACSGALHLARFANRVYLIYRKGDLRADPAWVTEAKQTKNITIIYNTNVTAIEGDGQKVTLVKLDRPYRKKNNLKAAGVFVEIGGAPIIDLAKKLGLKTDRDGFVITDNLMATNVSGVFCAGDVNAWQKQCQQAIIATAEGAIATLGVYQYLGKVPRKPAP
ncbi:MAG: FAD-dependent oxidoreductase [Candidatus Shapirobacteria bacterium]|nr:FAD-dependent oxidoreductase [Candidatus Shapirobacteria bacterium]MDD5073654.1 FAD-dependent oxidoreductase [Candidatus Shapirobacteria bacterium]MDD5481385.1 FAD-dependent oxidoreductase [Candidatus Shapirobacteria bacterium]